MKTILLILCLQLIIGGTYAQSVIELPKCLTKELTDLQITQAKKEITDFRAKRMKDLKTEDYPDGYIQMNMEYETDIKIIETLAKYREKNDGSTGGMLSLCDDETEAYDALLNKYYKKLLNRVNENDREIIRIAQRSWLKFRESETEMQSMLVKPEYKGGGGSMYAIYPSGLFLRLTKQRVKELFLHFSEIYSLE